MVKVEIYTTRTCGYCMMAKRLLDSKGVDYIEHPVDGNPEARAEMTQRSGGGRTVPQIFFNERPIGGCTELMGLDYSGELDRLLAG